MKTDERGYRSDNEPRYAASRTLCLTGDYSEANSNAFFALIAKEKFNIEFSRELDFSSKMKVRQELLRKAMEDSKEKAELIAACAGRKVVGIKKVNANKSCRDADDDDFDDLDKPPVLSRCITVSDSGLTDWIAPAAATEEVSIDVIWLIED